MKTQRIKIRIDKLVARRNECTRQLRRAEINRNEPAIQEWNANLITAERRIDANRAKLGARA